MSKEVPKTENRTEKLPETEVPATEPMTLAGPPFGFKYLEERLSREATLRRNERSLEEENV